MEFDYLNEQIVTQFSFSKEMQAERRHHISGYYYYTTSSLQDY